MRNLDFIYCENDCALVRVFRFVKNEKGTKSKFSDYRKKIITQISIHYHLLYQVLMHF